MADGRPYTVEMDSLIVTYGWMAHSVEPIGDLGTIPIHQSAASHPPAKRKGHQVRTLPSF